MCPAVFIVPVCDKASVHLFVREDTRGFSCNNRKKSEKSSRRLASFRISVTDLVFAPSKASFEIFHFYTFIVSRCFSSIAHPVCLAHPSLPSIFTTVAFVLL